MTFTAFCVYPLQCPFIPVILSPGLRAPPFSLLPTHLEAIVEDPMAPQQPGCPFEGTGRSREVEPLRWAGDDSQDKGRCPLPVQEIYPYLEKKATTPHSWPLGNRPPTQQTHVPHPSQGGKMTPPRVWPGMLPLLMLESLETANSVVFFPLSALVLLLTL